MPPSDPPPNFRRDAFAGLADDYVRYRLPYPAAMLDDLLARAAVPKTGARLLDLACGTGRVALAVAHRFDEVWAVDLEPQMVEAGRREAARRGVTNIRWSVGRAEEFTAPARAFDLVTVGDAFHRLERPRVAALVLGWLKRGGAFAVIGSDSFRDGAAPWRRVVAEVTRAFVGEPARRLGAPNAPLAQEIAEEEAQLRAAGFAELASHEWRIEHSWRLAELLGNLRSTSVLSRRALGERHAAFEAWLTADLLAHDPSGRYAETVRFGYTLARKP
jgi:SAM-dependent methyltransferase